MLNHLIQFLFLKKRRRTAPHYIKKMTTAIQWLVFSHKKQVKHHITAECDHAWDRWPIRFLMSTHCGCFNFLVSFLFYTVSTFSMHRLWSTTLNSCKRLCQQICITSLVPWSSPIIRGGNKLQILHYKIKGSNRIRIELYYCSFFKEDLFTLPLGALRYH